MDLYTILWIVLGLFVFVCGVVAVIIQLKTRKKINWIKVEATVHEVNQWQQRIGRSRIGRKKHYVYYELPTYRYTVNGQEYERIVRDRYRAGSLSVGMKMELIVDEEDPLHVHIDGDASNSLSSGLSMCVLGLGILFYGIIGWWALIIAGVIWILLVVFGPD